MIKRGVCERQKPNVTLPLMPPLFKLDTWYSYIPGILYLVARMKSPVSSWVREIRILSGLSPFFFCSPPSGWVGVENSGGSNT